LSETTREIDQDGLPAARAPRAFAGYPYKMKAQDMTQHYRKFKRSWGTWYAFDNDHPD
jgi:hypothetical protein